MFDTAPSLAVSATLQERAKALKGSGILGKSINGGLNSVTDSIARNVTRNKDLVNEKKRSLLSG